MRAWLLTLSIVPVVAHAEGRVAKSGVMRGHLVELFTSEGCSSCPPMETWLAQRKDGIALAFHVDYWDGIGWKDPYSSPRWTARQQRVADASGTGLYTPELALDGKEARRTLALTSTPATARIELSAREDGDAVVATTHVTSAPSGARVYIALREDGIVVDVPRGENAGRRLVHDAVVRALAGPLPLDGEARLPIPADAHRDKLSLVAFVEGAGSTPVLEALALPLR